MSDDIKPYRYFAKREQFGDVSAIRILFKIPGDRLPLHQHAEWNFHDMIVLRGRAEVRGPNGCWRMQAETGKIVVFNDYQAAEHEIIGIEPNTEVLNLYRHNRHREDVPWVTERGWMMDEYGVETNVDV